MKGRCIVAKPDGVYKCPRCHGEGQREETKGRDTEYESSVTTWETCSTCDGSGKVSYVNGMMEHEYLARKNQREKDALEYYHNTCFPFSALISTPSSGVPIGETYVGQIIFSRRDDGILVPRQITKKLVHGLAPLVKVEFTSGKSFRCVKIHSFLTDKGWFAAEEMHAGDRIIQGHQDVNQGIIKSITPTGTMEPVFNLYTQGEHNFIVDGCVAHNFTHFRTLRTILYRMFFDKIPEISVDNLSVQR